MGIGYENGTLVHFEDCASECPEEFSSASGAQCLVTCSWCLGWIAGWAACHEKREEKAPVEDDPQQGRLFSDED